MRTASGSALHGANSTGRTHNVLANARRVAGEGVARASNMGEGIRVSSCSTASRLAVGTSRVTTAPVPRAGAGPALLVVVTVGARAHALNIFRWRAITRMSLH